MKRKRGCSSFVHCHYPTYLQSLLLHEPAALESAYAQSPGYGLYRVVQVQFSGGRPESSRDNHLSIVWSY
jgi:hypothetical protein